MALYAFSYAFQLPYDLFGGELFEVQGHHHLEDAFAGFREQVHLAEVAHRVVQVLSRELVQLAVSTATAQVKYGTLDNPFLAHL